MSFRKELKYSLSTNELKLLKSNLLKNDFNEIYPKRQVNSCYFDNNSLDLFRLSLDGIFPRKKVRLRWYDENVSYCMKEQKISSIEGRYKLNNSFGEINLKDIKKYNFFDKDYGLLKPKILISYTREYFLYKELRFTFDYNIKYLKISGISQKKLKDFMSVIEVKTKPNISNDYINYIFGKFDNGFSKYTRGLIFLNQD